MVPPLHQVREAARENALASHSHSRRGSRSFRCIGPGASSKSSSSSSSSSSSDHKARKKEAFWLCTTILGWVCFTFLAGQRGESFSRLPGKLWLSLLMGYIGVIGLCWGDIGIMENETETIITGYIGIIQLSAEYATTAVTIFACSVQPAWVIEP